MTLHVIDAYRPGFGLPAAFYTSEAIFAAEQERIFRNGWYFAGHSIEIPDAGSYLTLSVGGAPVMVVRDRDGKVHAHHNVCRHRGSIICTHEKGRSTRLVCPYHAWTYAHDGRLIGAPMMGADFDKKSYGLKPVAVGEFDGLIFVNLAETPSPFEALREHLSPILKSQGMSRAKMALIRDYDLNVNWKIVVENNRECYHCEANHDGYVAVQYDTESDNPDLADEIAERLAECTARWGQAGLSVDRVNTSSNNTSEWFRANRTPVRKGMVTESPDGQLLCPVLMGELHRPRHGHGARQHQHQLLVSRKLRLCAHGAHHAGIADKDDRARLLAGRREGGGRPRLRYRQDRRIPRPGDVGGLGNLPPPVGRCYLAGIRAWPLFACQRAECRPLRAVVRAAAPRLTKTRQSARGLGASPPTQFR